MPSVNVQSANMPPHKPPETSTATSNHSAARPDESICKSSSIIGVKIAPAAGASNQIFLSVYEYQHQKNSAPNSINSEKCANVRTSACSLSYASPVAVAIGDCGAITEATS